MRALVLGTLLFAACGDDPTFIVVTVDKRAAVHNADSLKVTLSNAGTMLSKDLDLDEAPFPVTFSVSAPGRSGDLTISVDALDVDGALVGRGSGSTTVNEMTALVTLDSADFVVNHELANDQFLTTDYEAVGFQLAAITLPTGQQRWTSTFRDECTACNVFARRYDSTGLPVMSTLAAGNLGFPVSMTQTTNATMPAVASSPAMAGQSTLLFWDFTETTGGARGVACRALDEMGAATSMQLAVSTDPADVVSAAGLSNSNFAVVWQIFQSPTYIVRTVIVRPDCTPLGPVVNASTAPGMFGAQRPHVAANGSNILYTWIVDGDLRVRSASLAGVFGAAETAPVVKTASQEIEHVRVTPWQSGFAIAVRWASTTTDGPGKIELYRTNGTGALMGAPILITDNSRSDFGSNKGFSLAQRPDGALLVVWHVCETGPGLCDVFGRILRPTGAQVGPEFVIPTSTASEQINPSVIALQDSFVAAWNDSSGEAPDRSGTAVRARIVYPLYDDARGVHGATCGASAPGSPDCGEGLACAMGSDAVQRCYATCTPPSCPGGGTCNTVDETTSACTF